ncbi:protein kinase domain-containing protein [Bradyrhizobium sp. TM233]|uniref:protein kinase domain-containing protein n=1 Tax=Bradyrhizobium sp. TM233 TaxID=2599801 RepID=UPI0030C6C5AB|nr:hypothetical protein TM233_09460 [Bradyrhizobium sp. TM233]
MTTDRVKFDIACALAVVTPSSSLPNIFPNKLAIEGELSRILSSCIQKGSIGDSSCKLSTDVPQTDNYSLNIGKDKLRLAPGGAIILGGSGVTIQLHDPRIKRFFALKVPRVSVLAYKFPLFEELDQNNFQTRFENEVRAFENERLIFRRLSHEHIAQHLYGGDKSCAFTANNALTAHLPFSVSEWIDGARPLHKYLHSFLTDTPPEKLSFDRVISLIIQSFQALSHLQERKVLHWDIKSDNLLVSDKHAIKLIDFGNAKTLDVLDNSLDLLVTTTEGKYPALSQFDKVDTGQSESRRFQIRLPHLSWNDPFIDLWMLAQEWNRCLAISPHFLEGDERNEGRGQLAQADRTKLNDILSNARNSKDIDRFDCLRLIFDRILFPFKDRYRTRFSNGAKFRPDELYFGSQDSYSGATEVVEELTRVILPFGDGSSVPELQVSLDDIVRLPVTGNSVFTPRIQALIETSLVSPADKHIQLAQVRRVFPGATHTRFEHLLGTVTTATYFIRSLYLNEMNAFWRTSVTADDIDATLIAAILHDVGHIAFGHFLEEMSDFFSGLNHTDYTLAVLDKCLSSLGDPITNSVATKLFDVTEDLATELISVVENYWLRPNERDNGDARQASILLRKVRDVFKQQTFSSDLPTYISRRGTRQAVKSIMRSIIDGPLDADKLDYLRRDALHAGVHFANGIDLERFFESLRVCIHTDEKQIEASCAIGVSEKGIASIESIITARYQLFAVVYWHRITRSITAMLQRLLCEAFLAQTDNEWMEFLKELLFIFREQSDDQALEWLDRKLSHMSTRVLSEKRAHSTSPGKTVQSLVSALRGDRREYFKLAFELSYMTPIATENRQVGFPRKRLNEEISHRVHGDRKQQSGFTDLTKARRHQMNLATFRKELEQKFQETVRSLTRTDFHIDTILLDIPEPGKDQISAIQVDTRTKRFRPHQEIPQKLAKIFGGGAPSSKKEFVELTRLSPIASSLDSALNLWARKIRIFMSPTDLKALVSLGLAPGDISLIWERVLFDQFHIQDEDQSELNLAPAP